MSEGDQSTVRPQPPDGPAAGPERPDPSPAGSEPPAARPADAERGLRGAMSALLILEAITILLGIQVARNTGAGTDAAGVVVICVLAALHVACCAIVRRRYAWPVIGALQLALIGCWAVSAWIGVMGVIFALVWAAILWMRTEYRRRAAAWATRRPADR